MKNTLLSLIVYFCIGISATLAQNTNEDFGYTGGDRSKTLLNGNVIRTSNGSLAADTTKKLTLNGNVVNITSGFAFPVSYFPQVFGKPLFASKGYFAEYVELRWQILAAGNRINQFRIFRKPLGASQDSTLIGTVDANGRSFRDEFAEKGVIYKYTVFAAGIADGTVQPLINTIDAVGFSLATGTATGQITYEGGTAVPNVEVVAETNGDLRGKSLFLNGTNAFLSVADGNELLFHDGFSLQLWTRAIGNAKGVIFSKGEEYQLTYDPTINELTFKLGDELLTMPFEAPQDTFFHIAITYEPSDSLALYTLINDTLIDSVKIKPSNTPEYTDANLFFGKDSLGTTFYKGYMDEIRFWDKQLSFAEILSTFSRNLNGTEADLSGYWRLNAGVGEGFYDISRQGFDFNEHHGLHENGVWSAITPTASQLGFKGITDEAGNYAIVGFPYETSGSLYSFTPILGVHQFNPAQRTFFVGDGNAIINNVDFTDISSFSVTGNVRYSNTPDFGVEGVIILVDGQPVVGSDGQLSMTDHNGQFEVDVPIGNHFITLQKQGHTFEQAGRFPPATTDNAEPTFDFQEPLTGLTFWDTTLVKVAGRVVGGPVEAAYPLGFGLSTDNIGDATIVMTTQKGRDLTSITKSINLEERTINSTMSFDAINPRDITLTADPETGEYIAYLLPEKYTVKSVNASSNSFDPNSFSVVDLTSNIANEEILLDTVGILVNDHFLPEPVFNPADTLNRDEIIYPQFQDTTWIIAMDTFRFQHREDFIYRVTPTIDVTNTEGEEVFGERTFTYVDPNDDSSTQVDLITGTNYNFGHPIFRQLADYQMKIALSEQYTNTDGGSSVVDKVPVTDGQIEIRNDLAINTNLQTFNLDNQGELLYTFTGGTPEVNADPIDTQNSYTRTLGITAISGNNGAIKTVWRPSDPFRGIIFGAKPSGNNFTTLGPINVIAILRDPPGSNSYSFFDKSTSISSTTSVSTSEVEVTNNEAEVSLGFNLTSFVGLGAGVITKLEATEALEVGASVTRENSVDNTVTTTITTDQTWQTSDDKEFVGHRADVFVGTASNLIYGEATNLQIIPTTNCLTTSDCQQQNNGFSIGKLAGVSVADQITTSFTFTVNQIETQIIPGLEKLRNQLLEIGVDTSIVATDKVRYLSLLADTDPHFGSNNHDENIWGDQAKTGGVGPSYALKIPQTIIDTLVGPLTDSVFYYNTQIAGWHYWLRENERRKVQASLEENLSFDAGTSISKSFTVDTVKSTTRTHEWYYDSSIGRRTSAKINSVGLLAKITYTDQESEVDVDINDTTNVTTYGYVLEDGEGAPLAGGTVADFFTIDVKNPGDNFGPSFNLRGGVTSCPYEGEFRTQYFEPGQHVLSSATVRAENPEISVDNAVAANIPSNRQATFTLNLANNSEIGETNWYRLRVDDTTNPNGAILTMDGEFLTDGRSFLIPAGAITQKTLRVAQGQPDVMEYENIRLIFESLCDFSLEDSVEISVFFVPGCSDVNIDLPADNWVVNTNNQPEDRLNVAVNQYDLSHNNFKKALFQYKST
ncbi:MAG: LamG domain-containing protein, partial [Flammeovirgaceae bacterium]